MLQKIKSAVTKFYAFDRRLAELINSKIVKVEKFSHLVFALLIFGSVWAFAWNAHLVGPWLDNLLNVGPHDIDSIGKIRWRRMYSTALCAPPMLFVIARYTYTKWKNRL